MELIDGIKAQNAKGTTGRILSLLEGKGKYRRHLKAHQSQRSARQDRSCHDHASVFAARLMGDKLMARKTWQEKFESDRPSEVKVAPKNFADIKAGQQMLLTTPRELDAFICTLPPGESLSMKELRARLSRAKNAEIACPVVTGIHLRTIAEIVTAELDSGVPAKGVTPVWRVIEPGAPVTKKLERGPAKLMAQRRAEGLSDR